jgi:tetratricopeptide (TPR) repeat protein
MAQRRYDRAEPYALAAAQSGAAWALTNAANCCAALGKWDEAEELVKAEGERYGRPISWYEWCVLTGHGHRAAAVKAAEAYLKEIAGATDRERALERMTYLLGEGKTDEAMPVLRKAAQDTGDVWAGLHAALWLDGKKDAAGRDAVLKVVVERGPRHEVMGRPRREMVELAKLLRDAYAAGPTAAPLDLAKVDKIVADGWEPERANVLFFTAEFLALRGDEEGAKRYYARCLAQPEGGTTNRMLAAVELRKRGVDPAALLFGKRLL